MYEEYEFRSKMGNDCPAPNLLLNFHQYTREMIKMELMNNENVVSESDNKEIVLTTHRIRHSIKRWGKSRITSIMLEELDSCEIRTISSPLFLFFAALIALGGFIIGDDFVVYGFVVGLLFAAFYYFTRFQVISLKSSSSIINLRTTGMSLEMARSFIDTVEATKQNRYLLTHSK